MGARGTDRRGAGRGRMARLSRSQLLPHGDGVTHAPGDRIEATLDDRIEATLDALCSFRSATASLGHGGACAFKTCATLARATARVVLGVSWEDTSEQAGTGTALRGLSLGLSRSRGDSIGQMTSASLSWLSQRPSRCPCLPRQQATLDDRIGATQQEARAAPQSCYAQVCPLEPAQSPWKQASASWGLVGRRRTAP